LPELRQDLITGNWVIMAAERAKRPESFRQNRLQTGEKPPVYQPGCPFCPGNEAETPRERLVLKKDQASLAWQVRVIPNKFPAVAETSEAAEPAGPHAPAYGIHEIIVETPEHNRHPGQFSAAEMNLVLKAYLSRFQALEQKGNLRCVSLFKNHGRRAGASLEHPHSQLLALPFMPPTPAKEIEGARRYYESHGECPFCSLLAGGAGRERLILENRDFVALMPYAARFPWETWVLPKKHRSSFQHIDEPEQLQLAALLPKLLNLFDTRLEDPPYNYYLHTNPLNVKDTPYYHWHLELIPRLVTPAGFEQSSGMHINTVPPETAARFLTAIN